MSRRLPCSQGRRSSDNYDLLLAACLAGQGVLDCPHWSVQPLLASGRLVQVLPDYQIAPDAFGPLILAMYPSHRRATRKVQAFIEFIEAYPLPGSWRRAVGAGREAVLRGG